MKNLWKGMRWCWKTTKKYQKIWNVETTPKEKKQQKRSFKVKTIFNVSIFRKQCGFCFRNEVDLNYFNQNWWAALSRL